MSIKESIDKNYVKIAVSDLLKLMVEHKDNEKICNSCRKIFITNDIENDFVMLSSYDPVVLFLKKKRNDKYFIDASVLNEAIGIAISENNHEMQKILTSYFRKFMDNEKNGLSNEKIISDIISDKKLISFIKKYPSFDSYEQTVINKSYEKMQKQLRLSIEKQIKGRSII